MTDCADSTRKRSGREELLYILVTTVKDTYLDSLVVTKLEWILYLMVLSHHDCIGKKIRLPIWIRAYKKANQLNQMLSSHY